MSESKATELGGSYAHPTENELGHLLKTDALLAAEKLTGKSYKEDKDTDALGLALFLQHNKAKESALAAAGDTYYNISLPDYLAVVDDLGFKLVSLTEHQYRNQAEPLHHFVFVHPEGVVLSFTSWWTTYPEPHYKINGGNFYYNWKPSLGYWAAMDAARAADDHSLAPPHVTSSGGFENVHGIPHTIDNPDYDPDGPRDWEANPKRIDNPDFKREDLVYCGHHDCREGLRYNFNMLRNWGEFVQPWVALPFGGCFNLLALDDARTYYDIDRVDHDTAMSWPREKRREEAAKRRQAQQAAWDAHVETWPDEVKTLTAQAVERERSERQTRYRF